MGWNEPFSLPAAGSEACAGFSEQRILFLLLTLTVCPCCKCIAYGRYKYSTPTMLCSFTSHTAHSTQHTAHAAVTASHLISCSCSCFPSLPQRLELVLQPAVFASQGQRIVGTVAETTETPPAQFPVPTLHRSLVRWADRLGRLDRFLIFTPRSTNCLPLVV